MATTPKELVNGSQLTTSIATYYTVPASTKARITSAIVTNTSGGAVKVRIHLVASGDTADDTNTYLDDLTVTIASGATRVITEIIGQVMEAAGTIQMICDTATAACVGISGYEIV